MIGGFQAATLRLGKVLAFQPEESGIMHAHF